MNHSTNYTLNFADNGFEIKRPPLGSTVYALKSKAAHRMKKIRLAEHTLQKARSILDEGCKVIPEKNFLLREALASSASTFYFSIFQSGSLGLKLDPNHVFKSMPDALERHNDWARIRNSRFNHPDEVGRSIESCIIFDGERKFYDVVTFLMDGSSVQNSQWLQLLYQLICHAQKHLETEAEKTFQKMKLEGSAMSAEEISALEPVVVTRPDL